MPYIPQDQRKKIDHALDLLDIHRLPQGSLTYLIYKAMKLWVSGQATKDWHNQIQPDGSDKWVSIKGGYTILSQTIAAATDAAAEFRRMELVPYEDQKREENGPIE